MVSGLCFIRTPTKGQPPLKKPRIDSDSGECTGQYFLKFVERVWLGFVQLVRGRRSDILFLRNKGYLCTGLMSILLNVVVGVDSVKTLCGV